ncbi:unnamed protein product [Blepharisma stoltei]|uniref:Uncharacterized protein n=1 Tax=Blepharisma stoltei TaxID=1481888 RepID=A0AAU9K079_9CILI|nr:unnamed protein product [Blepharisma stoltei]
MVSYWLDPIIHETHGFYSDPVKLRLPMVVSQIRIAKPQSAIWQLEFLAKDLENPSDELVHVEKLERVDAAGTGDINIELPKPILTDYLVVKGDYKAISLCLETSEVTIDEESLSLTPTEAEVEKLIGAPMQYHGLFQYWVDSEETGEVLSMRYPIEEGPSQLAPFAFWKLPFAAEDLGSLVGQIESTVGNLAQGPEGPASVYLSSLEKLGLLVENLCSFYHTGHEYGYSGLKSTIERMLPPQIVNLALRAISGQSYGLSEAKASLRLVTVLMNSSNFSAQILEAGGLQHLLVLLTNPHCSSPLQIKTIEALKALISHPQNATKFIEEDFISSLDPKIISTYFSVKKAKSKEAVKKQKTEDEERFKTGYDVLVGMKTEKKSLKLLNAKKSLLSKCAFFQQLKKLQSIVSDIENLDGSGVLDVLDSIRKDLKLHMLRSSTNSLTTLKQDLKNFLLLDTLNTFENLKSITQLTSQQILSNGLVQWLTNTSFLQNLLRILLDQKLRSNAELFRSIFISISDILLVIIRSQGGVWFLTSQFSIIQDFIKAFKEVEIPDCTEEAELSLIEEEYLLSAIQLEKLPSYSSQLSFILSSVLSISRFLHEIFCINPNSGLANLYTFLNGADEKYTGYPSQIFYTIIRAHPEIFLYLLELIDLVDSFGMIRSFYVLEIAVTLMIEDRSGEVMLQVGTEAAEFLENLMETDGLDDIKKMLDLLRDWLRPLKKFKEVFSVEKLIEDLANFGEKLDKMENNSVYLVLQESKNPELKIGALGLMTEKGSEIIQLIQLLRILNIVISVKKWSSIQMISGNLLTIIANLIGKVNNVIHALFVDTTNPQVFFTLNKSQIMKEHLELLVPSLNIINIIIEQLLATKLSSYNNSRLLEHLVHLAALCDLVLDKGNDLTVQKVIRIIKTSFILWAQLPSFLDIYLGVMFEHAFQYPFKSGAVLSLISGLFEHFISYKDPAFIHKCIEWLCKTPAALFDPEVLYYYMMQAKNMEGEFKMMNIFKMSYEAIKEKSGSKYEPRQTWDFKKKMSLLLDRDGCVLDKLLKAFLRSNRIEVHSALVRLLRCAVATNHLEASMKIVTACKIMLQGSANIQGKALYTILALSEVACAKSLFIHEDLPEILLPFLSDPNLAVPALKVFRNLFDSSICMNEKDEKQMLVEDIPTISQTQSFLLETRKLLVFYIPGLPEAGMVEEEEDDLYGEFVKAKKTEEGCSWELTLLVLRVLKEISAHSVGKSLLLCGQYPFKEDLQGPLDFEETLNRISIGFNMPDWQNKMLTLLEVLTNILKDIGITLVSQVALNQTIQTLQTLSNPRAMKLLQTLKLAPIKVEVSTIELPYPKDLNERFPEQKPDFEKIKEFKKAVRKGHQNQLITSKRVGDRIQVKTFQSLTDLLPPPYKALFKCKTKTSGKEWNVLSEESQEFVPELTMEYQKKAEDKHSSAQPSREPIPVIPPVVADVVPAKSIVTQPVSAPAPVPQSVVPPQSAPRPTVSSPTSMFTDVEKNAFSDLMQLLEKKDRSHDPRLQLKIEQILNEFPNLCSYIKNKTGN